MSMIGIKFEHGFANYSSEDTALIGKKMHSFEASGLGKAPYKFTGWDTNGVAVDFCDHCGHQIVYRFHLLSSDGIAFKVGSSCIECSGDAGLVTIADGVRKQIAKEQAKARHQKVVEEFKSLLEVNKARLSAESHPYGYQNKNLFDYYAYAYRYSAKSNLKSFLVKLKSVLENI